MAVYLDDEGCTKNPRYIAKWIREDLKNSLGTVEKFQIYHRYLDIFPEMKEVIDKEFKKYFPKMLDK